MRVAGGLLCAALLASAGDSFALTLLQFDRVPEFRDGPVQRVVSSADGAFTAGQSSIPVPEPGVTGVWRVQIGVNVEVTCQRPDCHRDRWSFYFATRSSTPQATPGTYEGEGFAGPLEASYDSTILSTCPGEHQRIVVREAEYDPLDGHLIALAVDFERSCPDGPGGYSGVILWRAGNPACAGQPDGTACDDRNPCSANDTCAAGECLGSGGERCSLLSCDDGNPCTDDARDGTACIHRPLQGTCWDVTSRSTLTVSALGRSCSCRLPASRDVLALRDDHSFTIPGGEIGADLCPTRTATTVPDEVGVWQMRRRVRLLQTSNVTDLLAAATRCSGDLGIAVRRYGTRIRLSSDGGLLRGQQVLSGKVQGVPATARLTARLTGIPGAGDTLSVPTPQRLGDAVQRCTRRITACFRQ